MEWWVRYFLFAVMSTPIPYRIYVGKRHFLSFIVFLKRVKWISLAESSLKFPLLSECASEIIHEHQKISRYFILDVDSARGNTESHWRKTRKVKLFIFCKKIYSAWAVKEISASDRTKHELFNHRLIGLLLFSFLPMNSCQKTLATFPHLFPILISSIKPVMR